MTKSDLEKANRATAEIDALSAIVGIAIAVIAELAIMMGVKGLILVLFFIALLFVIYLSK